MKQIIPFQKELLFKTKVSEITSISLEHTVSIKNSDEIKGLFYISGDYKMTECSINKEKFSFELPFDIELDGEYDTTSIIMDIDNFYYEVINNESLKVNIDIYIEGNKIEKSEEESIDLEERIETNPTEIIKEKELKETKSEVEREENTKENIKEEKDNNEEKTKLPPKIEMLEEDFEENIKYSSPNTYYLEENEDSKNSMEFNIFENIDNSDTYVTYHVYIVKENDTIDKIIEKYGVTKEDISIYNNLDEIKPGTKLIIPNINE